MLRDGTISLLPHPRVPPGTQVWGTRTGRVCRHGTRPARGLHGREPVRSGIRSRETRRYRFRGNRVGESVGLRQDRKTRVPDGRDKCTFVDRPTSSHFWEHESKEEKPGYTVHVPCRSPGAREDLWSFDTGYGSRFSGHS